MVGRRFAVFSALSKSIEWVGDIVSLTRGIMTHDGGNVFMHSKKKGSKSTLVASTVASPAIMVGEILPSTFQQDGDLMLSVCQTEPLVGYAMKHMSRRPVVVFDDDIVTAESWIRRQVQMAEDVNVDEADDDHTSTSGPKFMSTVTFFKRSDAKAANSGTAGISTSTTTTSSCYTCRSITVEGIVQVYYLFALSDKHVGALCLEQYGYESTNFSWAEMDNPELSLQLVVFHVDSATEIGRCTVHKPFDGLDRIVPLVSRSGGTIGVALTCRGVAITGSDVYEAQERMTSANNPLAEMLAESASKRKSKPNRKVKGKKDGFARGISLRG
jgi:hypothetical protein